MPIIPGLEIPPAAMNILMPLAVVFGGIVLYFIVSAVMGGRGRRKKFKTDIGALVYDIATKEVWDVDLLRLGEGVYGTIPDVDSFPTILVAHPSTQLYLYRRGKLKRRVFSAIGYGMIALPIEVEKIAGISWLKQAFPQLAKIKDPVDLLTEVLYTLKETEGEIRINPNLRVAVAFNHDEANMFISDQLQLLGEAILRYAEGVTGIEMFSDWVRAWAALAEARWSWARYVIIGIVVVAFAIGIMFSLMRGGG